VLDENSTVNPISLYARTKIACEQVLIDLRDGRFQPVILRFGTVYGLSGRTRFDLIINLLTAKAAIDGEITLFGSDQWRPFVHVDDAARAILMAVEAAGANLEQAIFNVGSDEQNRTLGEIGDLIRQFVPTAALKCTDDDTVDRRNYHVKFARIREALGFLPQWSIEEGVMQVLEAIATGKVVNYRDARYSNVKFLSEEDGRSKLPVTNGWAKEMVEVWESAGSTA
jgi:nucleoside-diphosphate-sugar epimerase